MKMIKKHLLCFLIFTVLLTACSCNNKDHPKNDTPPQGNQQTEQPVKTEEPSKTKMPPENNHELKVSPNDKSIVELSSTVYSKSQLEEITSFSGSIWALNMKYPITCLRKTNNGFRAAYRGKESVAIVYFNEAGHTKDAGMSFDAKHLKDDFAALSVGQPLSDVQKIDSSERPYLFLKLGTSCYDYSTHYTQDGYIITIYYGTDVTGNTFVITHIQIEYI